MIDATSPPPLLVVSSSLVLRPLTIVRAVVASADVSVVTRSSFVCIGICSPFLRSPFVFICSPFVVVVTVAVAAVALSFPTLPPPTRRPTGDGGRKGRHAEECR